MSGTWGEGWASDFGGQPIPGLEIPGTDRIGKALRDVIEAAMGMAPRTVVPADQSAPAGRVDQGFATYKIIDTKDAAWAEAENATQADGSELEAVSVPQYLTVSVNFYRGRNPKTDAAGMPIYSTGAFDQASRLPRRLQLTAFAEALRAAGLGFIGASPPRNLAGLADGHWESRGQVDLYISAVALETAPVTVFSGLGGITINVDP